MMNAGIITPSAGYLAGAQGPAALRRRAAHLRRGQDRPDRGAERGHRADRGDARHHLPGEGDRRRDRRRRDRRVEQVMSAIADGRYEQVGTFNGNPLAMAAARAMLCEVLDEAGLRGSTARRAGAVAGFEAQIAAAGLPRTWCRRAPRAAWSSRPSRCATTAASSTSTTAGATSLALPAQRRRLPAAVGQDRAVADLRAAQRGRHRPARRELRQARGDRRRARADLWADFWADFGAA